MPRKRVNPLAIQKKYACTFSHYNVVNKDTKQLLAQAANKPQALQIKRTINDMYGYPTRRVPLKRDRARTVADILNDPNLGIDPEPPKRKSVVDGRTLVAMFDEDPSLFGGVRSRQPSAFDVLNDIEPYDWDLQTSNNLNDSTSEF